MYKFITLLVITFLLLISNQSFSQITEMWDKTISEQKGNAKAQWFQDAKFGLFVHWDLFAQHVGEWNGKRYNGSKI